MTLSTPERPRLHLPRLARAALGSLRRDTRFSLYRRMVDCEAAPDPRLTLEIAATKDDLEACFALLHDAYVASGFMKPDPSGLRVTPYHALPTTTTLCARFDGRVVGTLSIIREGVFGFPMQSVFDLTAVRTQPGRIAEISALAIHPRHRNTGGTILFPLMKFMYEYCTKYFDTRHLVIAVNPKHIDMYESLLLFQRLQESVVSSYDFVNGAPAIGATLDLANAPRAFSAVYEGRPARRNLHHYFTRVALPNIRFPDRPYFTTSDPVMSPALLDHFFNRRTRVFDALNERQVQLLHAIYPEDVYGDVLPAPPAGASAASRLRRHRRLSLKCPARLEPAGSGPQSVLAMEVIDVSLHGFLARADAALPEKAAGRARVELGSGKTATESAVAVRCISAAGGPYYGFHIAEPSPLWRRCIEELESRDLPPGTAAASRHPPGTAAEAWPDHEALPA